MGYLIFPFSSSGPEEDLKAGEKEHPLTTKQRKINSLRLNNDIDDPPRYINDFFWHSATKHFRNITLI